MNVITSRLSLANAKSSAVMDAKQSAVSIAAAQRQLSVDKGQEKVDLFQQQKDQTQYATADLATAAVNADKAQRAAAASPSGAAPGRAAAMRTSGSRSAR